MNRVMALRGLALATLVAAAFGCDSIVTVTPGPSASESGPPRLGIDWTRATSVQRPANFEETVAPSYQGAHPILRIQGQATMTDLADLGGGSVVAVGYAPPDWLPVAWTSRDREIWAIHSMGTAGSTFPVALTSLDDGSVVAVGRSGAKPVAWTTTDGVTWQRRSVPTLGRDGVPERMTAVARGSNGLVAGGSVGPELLGRRARFWRSTDGMTWKAVPNDRAAFANAEVRSITPYEDGFVAVGVVGSVQDPTGAVAWTSPDGVKWTRIDDPAFDGGVAVSIGPSPVGGVIAVGSQVDRRMAVAWTSPDGRSWTRAPDETSREHPGGFAWMTDVTAIGDVAIAVGDIQGLQRGTAMAWVSRDGLTWTRSSRSPTQEGAEWYAIAPGGPGAVVLGAFGAPDSYVPEVWLSPGR
jgi:hypothetical protein